MSFLDIFDENMYKLYHIFIEGLLVINQMVNKLENNLVYCTEDVDLFKKFPLDECFY
jgi:hypothetical protein